MKLLRWLLLTFVICGCSLPPLPVDPVPPPGPTPVVKVPSLWIETIDSFGKRSGDVRKLMTDLPYWASLQGRGHHYRHLDVTADADEVNKKLQVFLDVKPPCAILYNAADDLPLGAAPLTTKAALDQIISKFSDK